MQTRGYQSDTRTRFAMHSEGISKHVHCQRVKGGIAHLLGDVLVPGVGGFDDSLASRPVFQERGQPVRWHAYIQRPGRGYYRRTSCVEYLPDQSDCCLRVGMRVKSATATDKEDHHS